MLSVDAPPIHTSSVQGLSSRCVRDFAVCTGHWKRLLVAELYGKLTLMENLDPIAHVEPQLLVELGRLTILAGRLEALMNDIARSLAIKEPQKHSFSKVAKASKKQIKANDLPDCSRVDPQQLTTWIRGPDLSGR